MKTNILPPILLSFVLVVGCFFLGKFLTEAQHPAIVGIGLSAGLLAAVLTFIQPILGLYILTFSMLLSPELTLAQIGDRAVIVRVDDLLIILIFIAWAARTAIRKDISFIRQSPLHRPIFVYYFLIFFASGINVLRGDAAPLQAFFYSMKYLEYVIIFILAVNIVETPEQIAGLLKAMFVTAGIVLLFGYITVMTTNLAPFCPFDIEKGEAEPATLGGYLVLLMGVAWGIFSRSAQGPWSLWLIGFWIASVPMIFLTKSRASYISFAVVLALTTLFERRRRIVLSFLIVGAVLMVNLVFPRVYQTAKNRILYTFQPQGGPQRQIAGKTFQLEQSAESRIKFWKRAFSYYLPQHAILGHGVSPRPALEGQIPVIAYETGILGILFFLWMIWSIIKESYRLFDEHPSRELSGLGLGFLLGFAGVWTHSLVNTSFIIIRIMEPFWFLVGLICVANRFMPGIPRKIDLVSSVHKL